MPLDSQNRYLQSCHNPRTIRLQVKLYLSGNQRLSCEAELRYDFVRKPNKCKATAMKKILSFIFCLIVLSVVATNSTFAVEASSSISDDVLKKIEAKSDLIYPELVAIRRQVHMHPELSGQEKETSAFVERRLRELGYDVQAHVGGYGVIGVMKGGGGPGRIVAYRADMDALPMQTVGDQPYKSATPGVNHACGHDVHVAIGLGIAEVFASLRETFPGTIKLIFQPSEENAQGAYRMIKDGALENPRPDYIYAVHTAPFEVGRIGCAPGVGLASQRPFHVTLQGGPDAVRSAAPKIVAALNAASTVPRITSPADMENVMKTMGQASYGDFIMIMARSSAAGDGTKVDGQLRTPNDAVDARAVKLINDTVEKAAGENSVKATTEFDALYLPAMVSNPALTNAAEPIIARVLGPASILRMTSSEPYFGEDFSFFNREVPGAFFFVGMANTKKGIRAYNHMPDYDVDEDGIRNATKTMAGVIYDTLLRPARSSR